MGKTKTNTTCTNVLIPRAWLSCQNGYIAVMTVRGVKLSKITNAPVGGMETQMGVSVCGEEGKCERKILIFPIKKLINITPNSKIKK